MNSHVSDLDRNSAWHALHIRHQSEKMVAEFLSNRGFETFLPLYPAVHRWKDRNKHLMLPLFPCYVFVRGGLERRLQIITTPGVHGIVETAGRAGVIPESEITDIRRAVENTLRVEPHPFLRGGDWVRIKSGPLVGLEGILVSIQSRYRLVLSVEMIGRSVAVEVESSAVERISNPNADGNPSRLVWQSA